MLTGFSVSIATILSLRCLPPHDTWIIGSEVIPSFLLTGLCSNRGEAYYERGKQFGIALHLTEQGLKEFCWPVVGGVGKGDAGDNLRPRR